MIVHQGIYLPDGETHLTDWMNRAGEVIDGKGSYQIKKLRIATSHCRQFRTAVDVGAHVGMWTMQLAKRFAYVQSFEPVAAHRECFALNVDALNVTLHPCALSETEGSVAIHTSPTSSGDSWIEGPGEIPLRTLDSFELDDVDFMKIDTEGHELSVLRGGEQTIKRCRPVVIVEQKREHSLRFGLPKLGAVDYLLGLGYTLARELSGDFILTP